MPEAEQQRRDMVAEVLAQPVGQELVALLVAMVAQDIRGI
jgi:hypothetical protein